MPDTRAQHLATETETAGPEPSITEVDPAPAKKKRGRPRKDPIATAPTATSPTTGDGATSVVPPKKAPQKKPPKRLNPSDATTESSNSGDADAPIAEDQPPPAKRSKAQKSAPTPSRDPLPSRARNNHPGTPDVPRPKRSSAEVKAARKELEAIEAHKAQMEARKVQLYAELEMEEEAAQEAEARNVVKTLAQVREDGPEEFSFSRIDAEESEEEDVGVEKKGGAQETNERPKKAVRKARSLCCIMQGTDWLTRTAKIEAR